MLAGASAWLTLVRIMYGRGGRALANFMSICLVAGCQPPCMAWRSPAIITGIQTPEVGSLRENGCLGGLTLWNDILKSSSPQTPSPKSPDISLPEAENSSGGVEASRYTLHQPGLPCGRLLPSRHPSRTFPSGLNSQSIPVS